MINKIQDVKVITYKNIVKSNKYNNYAINLKKYR